jgi:hypothetical protein
MLFTAVIPNCYCVALSQAMGGRFSSLMPSDLSKPGALAFESIPARADNSEAYAQPSVKRELARIFRRDGCHHCGEGAVSSSWRRNCVSALYVADVGGMTAATAAVRHLLSKARAGPHVQDGRLPPLR